MLKWNIQHSRYSLDFGSMRMVIYRSKIIYESWDRRIYLMMVINKNEENENVWFLARKPLNDIPKSNTSREGDNNGLF
ncbi:unnamed protein product [Ceutorhynchus assimilis]|uniref:Uncharacterized protein n=1 Tax=Ceutorhynchus assimilis TaxID=467358 RepID=A0A9N9MBI3_9CUCU|nr:unnamed protein product [Ceutorhynchus assimilis]